MFQWYSLKDLVKWCPSITHRWLTLSFPRALHIEYFMAPRKTQLIAKVHAVKSGKTIMAR